MITQRIGIETAIPAFIGYTRRAGDCGNDVTLTPTLVRSHDEFQALFGGDGEAPVPTRGEGQPFYLSRSVRLFYENGGDRCYIVSVGSYADRVDAVRLAAGLDAIEGQVGPTMLVIPDALLLPAIADFSAIAQQMLDQCGRLGDRVAILDVFGADTLAPGDLEGLARLVSEFHDAVGVEHLDYGMAYFPCLHVAVASERGAAGVRGDAAAPAVFAPALIISAITASGTPAAFNAASASADVSKCVFDAPIFSTMTSLPRWALTISTMSVLRSTSRCCACNARPHTSMRTIVA
jgi:hypothetical protein